MLANVARRVRPRVLSKSDSQPAPIEGWNARDPLSDMPEKQAVFLDNFFPERSRVRLRNGSADHATGMTGNIESLMTWTGGSTAEMFAAVGGSVYDVTVAGAVGAAEFGSMTSNRWQHVNFETAGGHFLYLVNGADAPRYYDGTSWTVPTITGSGLTNSDLIYVNEFKERLFFIEKNTMSVWYFPVLTIAGAITEFPMGQLFKLGGHLVAMGSWTLDAGSGLDDYAVFITSEGEVAIYAGTDPGAAADWVLVGIFRMGAPVGQRPLMKVGSSLIVINEDGFSSIADALQAARSSEAAHLSDQIRESVNRAVNLYRSNFGWEAILFPAGNKVIFNIPVADSATSHQYVFNSTTGAPCRFVGWDAFSWQLLNNDLYFGTTDKVVKADTGQADSGANIEGDGMGAFKYFGSSSLKQFHQVRPVLGITGSISPAIGVGVDFDTTPVTTTPSFGSGAGSPWNTSPWNTTPWTSGLKISKGWQSSNAIGFAAAIRLKVAANLQEVEWYSTDWIYEPGGFY